MAGCTSGSNQTGSIPPFNFVDDEPGVGGAAGRGTVTVFLADPGTDDAQPPVRRTLTFFGLNRQNQVTFEPVTLEYSPEQTLENVPVETTTIVVTDPSDPSVLASEQVTVIEGETTFVSDVVMLPAPTAPLVSLRQAKFDGNPVAVGKGFVQTKPVKLSNAEAGSDNVIAGANATSATDDLPHPYKTNSWLGGILTLDNHSQVYAGGGSTPGTYAPAPANPQTMFQMPIYPHPWIIYYNTSDHPIGGRSAPAVVPGFAPLKGLRLKAEVPIFVSGTAIPASDGTNSATSYGEINTLYDQDQITVDPGFLSDRMKVSRMGDYDGDFMLRAVDDPNFSKLNPALPKDAGLKLTAVRGNPMLYFRAIKLPSVNLYHTLSPASGGTLNSKTGTLTVGGKQIGYVAWKGEYGPVGFSHVRSSVLFFSNPAAKFSQQAAVKNEGAGGDAFYSVKTSLTFTNANTTNFFVLVNLPDETFADESSLAGLALRAFNYPVGTTVTYTYNPANQTVSVTYSMANGNILGFAGGSLSGLMPHHYQPNPMHNNDPILVGSPPLLSNAGGAQMKFPLSQGMLQIYATNRFTCSYPVPGILPFMPPLDAADVAGRNELQNWIVNQFVGKWNGSVPAYMNQNAAKGSQCYQIAKFVQRNMLILPAIDMFSIKVKINNADVVLADVVYNNTKAAMELFFRQTPTQTAETAGSAPYYNRYDPLVGSLFQYPQGQPPANPDFPSDINQPAHEAFGALTMLNDHHFHYGYFIHAAAQIAIRDPQWGKDWRDAINQYVFDVANTDAINPPATRVFPFPKERFWDAYMGHSYSAGLMRGQNQGNNQESISEELNFWIGTALWGGVTGQQAMRDHALARFACAVHSSYMYWFDVSGNKLKIAAGIPNAKVNWPGSGGAILYDAHTGFNTFFGAHPSAGRTIIVLPVTPGCFYLAMNPAITKQIIADYQAFVKKFDIDPMNPSVGQDKNGGPYSLKNPFRNVLGYQSQLAKWMAMVNPTDAMTNKGFYFPPNNRDTVDNGSGDIITPIDQVTDEGDTAGLTYHMTHYMATHGTPNLWIKSTNSPFYMVFDNTTTKKRTYVGFNSTGATMNISFSDGTVINNVGSMKTGTLEVALP